MEDNLRQKHEALSENKAKRAGNVAQVEECIPSAARPPLPKTTQQTKPILKAGGGGFKKELTEGMNLVKIQYV
jgi:hypothetical protein